MAKKPGLLSAVLAEPPTNRGPKSWFQNMPEGEVKNQLRELHAAFKAGKLDGYSKLHLHAKAQELLGLTIGSNGFEGWLKRASPDG
jgi:hypothetical protein